MRSAIRQIITAPPPLIPPYLRPFVAAFYDSAKLMGMNNATIAKWFDSSGNGRHATMTGLAWTAGSTLGANGFEVDGVDDVATIADSPATRLTTGGTLTAWIYPKGIGETGGRIFDKSADLNMTNGYSLYLGSNNTVNFRINVGTITASNANAITYNKFQRAVVTFDATGRHLYVNGKDVTASGGAETALPPDVAGVVAIGNRAGAADRTFDGYIDKPTIITRVLTPWEIFKDFQNTRRHYGV